MRSVAICCLAAWLFILSVLGDADFYDVRTNLRRDRSGKKGDPIGKYFHESIFHPHYDGRFAQYTINEDQRLPHLTALMQNYLATMEDIGAETWIMHGTLLGWWWNQKILPWDTDIDAQVSEETIYFLAKYYNMTEYHFDLPDLQTSRTYLLEVNPHYNIGSTNDWLNMIDARWIDTDTGLFIDVSTVRVDDEARATGLDGALMVKDRHHYVDKDIFPLRESTFEGVRVKIPYDYTWLLEEEYGKDCMVTTSFERHEWNESSKLWEPRKQRNTWKPSHRKDWFDMQNLSTPSEIWSTTSTKIPAATKVSSSASTSNVPTYMPAPPPRLRQKSEFGES